MTGRIIYKLDQTNMGLASIDESLQLIEKSISTANANSPSAHILDDIMHLTAIHDTEDKNIHLYIYASDAKNRYHALGDEILQTQDNYLHIYNKEKKQFEIINNDIIEKIIIRKEEEQ